VDQSVSQVDSQIENEQNIEMTEWTKNATVLEIPRGILRMETEIDAPDNDRSAARSGKFKKTCRQGIIYLLRGNLLHFISCFDLVVVIAECVILLDLTTSFILYMPVFAALAGGKLPLYRPL
jgi:hypothetical protein